MIVVAEIDAHRTVGVPFAAQRRTSEHAHIRERAIVIVVVQIIWSGIVRDIQIGPAVIVVIAPYDA